MEFIRNHAGSIYRIKGSKLKLTIHNYVGCGNEWFLSCNELGFNSVDLNTEDFETAVKSTKEKIKNRIEFLSKEVKKICNDESEITFTRY